MLRYLNRFGGNIFYFFPAKRRENAQKKEFIKIFSRPFASFRGKINLIGISVSLSLFILFLNGLSFAQTLPKSALILEKQNVTDERQLILWMQSPKKNPRSAEDDLYTCPDETRGHYYSGKANVSLIDAKTKKIINTIPIKGNGVTSENDTIDLPYRIRRGYYDVPEIDENKEGKPLLMNLKDYNDDGFAEEFALFDAVACMGLETTLIGYSRKRDQVIQYQTELKTPDGKTSLNYWVDYFFSHTPAKKMFWKYEIDYRGRAGFLDKYEIRYDAGKEMFFGTLEFEEDVEQ